MRADAYSIRNLIQTDICYGIPIFQRRYVWKEEQWERFAEDMDSLLDDNRTYFLGSLILKGEALGEQDRNNYIREKYIVIDGQQRLTTLFIYMKLLFVKTGCIGDFAHDYCRNSQLNQPILNHNSDDTAPFRKVLSREIFGEIDNPKSNIEKAHNFFVQHLNEKYGDDTKRINHLRNTIQQRVNFVGIKLDVGENNEQQIFDTINNLGVDLDTAELLKNFLFIRQEDEQSYRREGGWKSMFDSDDALKFWKRDTEKSRQNVKKENKNIEQFLNAYVRIKMYGDYKERFAEQRRKTLAKLAYTYDACKDLVEVCGVSRQDLADEIIEYARLFKQHFVMDKLDEPIKSYHCIERIIYIILATKKYSLVPYVLFLLKNVNDQNELDRISKYLESYVVRRILANTKDKSYSDLFGESLISQNITTAQGLKEYISNREDSNLEMPSAFEIRNGITVRSTAVGEETARLIYYLYDVSFNNNNNLGYNDCLAVQLMPKSVANTDWTACCTDVQENTRQDRCKTFGNYFLIKEENNGNWKRARLKEAKIRHIHGCKEMFASNQILDDPNLHRPVNDWTSDSINDRNKLLAKAFDGTWEI